MTGIYILIAVTIAFAVCCVALRRKNKSFEGMICKFMASFGFLAIAIIGNYIDPANTVYFSFIAIGLMFGFCGDVFLGIKEIAPTFKKKLIPIGTGYFLIGHIFYVIALTTLYGFKALTLIFYAVGFLIAYIGMTVVKMQTKGALKLIMSFYYGVLVWRLAVSLYVVIQEASVANILALIGSVLFIISDTCLSFVYFYPVKRKNALVTAELSTYYPAQILFAMSVAFR